MRWAGLIPQNTITIGDSRNENLVKNVKQDAERTRHEEIRLKCRIEEIKQWTKNRKIERNPHIGRMARD